MVRPTGVNRSEKRPAEANDEEEEETAQSTMSPIPRPKRRRGPSSNAVIEDRSDWADVISALQPAIVALKVTYVRAFEEGTASTSVGSGFVVDHTRGLILTNRHVMGVGPSRALAIFDKNEEVDVEVVYRDPVHDFGFFRFDPAKLRHTRAAEIPLDPAGLVVGEDVRVVGNDAGEKLQILAATIARTDRNVPEINSIYNDENTFYAGAGAGTSGGSSGSPVLNRQGCAVALNAAGIDGAATSFFLPLHRVRYAFERLCAGKPIPRGTLMAALLFKPYDELKRVGLREKDERDVLAASPDATGMLVVERVMTEQQLLRPGDIVLRVDREVCVGFAQLEAVLDARVGSKVRLLVCREGQQHDLLVPVEDLHSLIPRSFVELGLDMLHNIGYHLAKHVNLPLDSGMLLTKMGFVFSSVGCGRGALITSVNGRGTPNAEALVEALSGVPEGAYFPVSWFELGSFSRDRSLRTGFGKMARAWSPLVMWRSEGSAGRQERWAPTVLPPAPVARHVAPALLPGGAQPGGGDRLTRQLQGSLVKIRFRTDQRFSMEGSPSASSQGVGVLVDVDKGLVLTDRHSAPQSLGSVEVSLMDATTLEAAVVFIHPIHNLAVLRCDTRSLLRAKLPLRAAKLAVGAKASLRTGEEVNFVGFDNQGNCFGTKVMVSAVYLPSEGEEFPMWEIPRFRERNLEVVALTNAPSDCRGGVLCDSSGVVRALYAAFDWQSQESEVTVECFGVQACVFQPVLDALRKAPNQSPVVRSLDVEVSAIDVSSLVRGSAGRVPSEWLQAVGQRCSRQGQPARALRVQRVLPMGAADGRIFPGDVVLSVGGRTIACCFDIEEALQASPTTSKSEAPGKTKAKAKAKASSSPRASGTVVRVFREGREVDVEVQPVALGSEDDARLVIWAGLIFRATQRSFFERCDREVAKSASGVYAQAVIGGSPGESRDFGPNVFLQDIDGVPIRGLDDLLAASTAAHKAAGAGERPWVRVRALDLHGQEHMKALQCDNLFFPTMELVRGQRGQWQCIQH